MDGTRWPNLWVGMTFILKQCIMIVFLSLFLLKGKTYSERFFCLSDIELPTGCLPCITAKKNLFDALLVCKYIWDSFLSVSGGIFLKRILQGRSSDFMLASTSYNILYNNSWRRLSGNWGTDSVQWQGYILTVWRQANIMGTKWNKTALTGSSWEPK